MMKLIKDPQRTTPCVLVLGMFDGVHRGHQALLMRGAAMVEEMQVPLNVCTFEPHPLAVLCPERAPARLTTQTERAQLMAGFGVNSLCVMSFTRAVAEQPPETFMEQMTAIFSPRAVVCGFNFTFGCRGMGTGESLRAYGETHGFETVIVPEVILEGATVSSTRVRAMLEEGRVREAARLMGHAVTLTGRAAREDRPGRARLTLPRNKALPCPGVYACYLTLDGQNYPAAASVGDGEAQGHISVTALDSCVRLGGRQVRLTFMDRLADAAPETARAFFFSVR